MQNDLISRSALIDEIDEMIYNITYTSPFQKQIEARRDGMERVLSEVKFSAGHVHTIHQGFLHVWQCKDYELSEDTKKIMEVLKKQFPTSAKMEG